MILADYCMEPTTNALKLVPKDKWWTNFTACEYFHFTECIF